jgi:lactonase
VNENDLPAGLPKNNPAKSHAGGRRGILVATLGGLCVAAVGAKAQLAQNVASGLSYDERTRGQAPIPTAERGLQTVTAAPWFKVSDQGLVLEGPAFDRQGSLFVCDASEGRVLRLSADKRLSTFVSLDLKPGGLAIHKDGRLFIAALDIPRGTGAVFEVRPDGSGLQTVVPPEAGYMPNDLVFDAKGGLYFTDFRGTSTDPRGGIYYVPPTSSTIMPVLQSIAKANGVALSPDGKVLWATEFGRNQLHRIELADATTPMPLGTAVPYHFIGTAPDSMRTDADGNVYVAIYGQGRVLVFSRIGIPIGQVLLPGREGGHNLLATNTALRPGTNELFIVASDGDSGQGATIFRAEAFAAAPSLYSHQ